MTRRKNAILSVLTGAICLGMVFPSLAGSWQSNLTGWWWQEDDGSYPVNGWKWIDGNGDGAAECYYFNEQGYCLLNTYAPDGYQVNENGAWVVDGVVQYQTASAVQQQVNISESTAQKLLSIADYVYHITDGCAHGTPVNVSALSATSSQKNYVFYCYQYAYCDIDPRITHSFDHNDHPENKILQSDVRAIMEDLFVTVTDNDLAEFYQMSTKEGGYCYVEAFEPEAGDPYYLSDKDLAVSVENGRIKLSGSVGRMYSGNPAAYHFTAYFAPRPGSCLDGYCFEQLIVQ